MAEKKNVPEIRFMGFSEDWEERELGKLVKLSSSKRVHLVDYVVTGIPFFRGLEISKLGSSSTLKDLLYISEEHYIELKERYGVPQVGDILITAVGTLGNTFLVRDNTPFYFKDGNLIWLSDIQIKSDYLEIFIGDGIGKKRVLNSAVGSNQKALTMVKLQNIKVSFPNNDEQTQLGTFFQHLDHLITLHQQKYNKLVTVKKAMLEKMFPQNGAVVPEIRFKGFTEAWEQRKLGEIAELLTGYPFESKSFIKDGIPLVRGMNVKRGYLDMSKDICEYWPSSDGLENFLLRESDVVIQMDGALIGKSYAKIQSKSIPALLVQRVTRVRSEKVNCDFIYQWIQKDFLKHILSIKTETAVPHLSLNDIRDFKIVIPAENEQSKLGNYFKHLDNLITLQQRELEKLKSIKKACLEKMFV